MSNSVQYPKPNRKSSVQSSGQYPVGNQPSNVPLVGQYPMKNHNPTYGKPIYEDLSVNPYPYHPYPGKNQSKIRMLKSETFNSRTLT